MSNKISGIYEIKNTVNGHRYIGSSVDIKHRWGCHRRMLIRGNHHSPQLQRSWDVNGECAFEFNVLVLCEKFELLRYEQWFIDAHKPFYNCDPTAGSRLGAKFTEKGRANLSAGHLGKKRAPFTEEHRRNISESKKSSPACKAQIERLIEMSVGRIASEETRMKLSMAKKGIKKSDETRARMSLAQRGRKLSPEHCAKMGATKKGKPLSAEHRAKLSAARKGRVSSAETRAKIADANRRRVVSDETRAKISASKLGVKLGPRNAKTNPTEMICGNS